MKVDQSKKTGLHKHKTLYLISLCLIIFLCILLYNKNYLLNYYANLRYNDFKVNDKLYANDRVVNKNGSYNLNLYKKIRPLTNDDIDAMSNMSLSEKALVKSKLNTSNKPAIVKCAWAINSDSLCKYKTAWIGNYTGSEILDIKFGKKYYPMIFFSITTNKKALIKEPESSSTDLPPGYVYEDSQVYVSTFDITEKELHQFRIINK